MQMKDYQNSEFILSSDQIAVAVSAHYIVG